MRQLVLIIFAIFTFNLLSEIASGHCGESEGQNAPEAIAAFDCGAHHSGSDPIQHSGSDHACHFGHCGHVLAPTENSLLVFQSAVGKWTRNSASPVWRDLAPLFKPPIA